MNENEQRLSASAVPDMLAFWGKTYDGEAASSSKPVVHHLFDAAAVAHELLESRPAFLARLSHALGVPGPVARNFSALLAGLHDLGKFSAPFQAKRPDLWPAAALGRLGDVGIDGSHWCYTALLMHEGGVAASLERAFGVGWREIRDEIVAVAAGHHGRPPETEWLGVSGPRVTARTLRSEKRALPDACLHAAAEAAEALVGLLAGQGFEPIGKARLTRMSLLLNGLVTTADWIASGFPVPETSARRPFDASAYWDVARAMARGAIRERVLAPPAVATVAWPSLGLAHDGLRPMQAAIDEVTIEPGPNLFIVEDMTGTGKTEAALMLASRLMRAGKGEGVYFALPTMATANAMHERLAACHRAFFTSEDAIEPSLVLAHGKAGLARRIARLGADENTGGVAAHCNDWIADSRRKALFAEIGAGTIDQAFLAVLRKKFLTLRQFALANRILIVDEAHSFDAYMGEEMLALLRLHAINGGSVIVLSATLTSDLRQAFASAFRHACWQPPSGIDVSGLSRSEQEEARKPPPMELSSRAFPLVTQVHAGGSLERPTTYFDPGRPRVAVKRLENRAEAAVEAVAAAQQGAAVAIVCNAVDEAIATHAAVLALLGDPDAVMLFHARFAMADRMAIERRVLDTFGRNADANRRAGKILVATQVIEQSLDLDFDFMVSDLAPVDLIVQRAGRLWRHMTPRPAKERPMSTPCLAVVAPDPEGVRSPRWLTPALGDGAFVYRHPGVMWRSAKYLFTLGSLPRPDEPAFREMLDTAYAADEDDLPACLRAGALKEQGDEHGKQTLGRLNVIKPEDGYAILAGELCNNEDIGTRLGEDQATLRLARRVDGRLVPWATLAGADEPLLWALSEIACARWRLGNEQPPRQAAEFEAIKARWPKFEHTILIAEVDGDGAFLSVGADLAYTAEVGLVRRERDDMG